MWPMLTKNNDIKYWYGSLGYSFTENSSSNINICSLYFICTEESRDVDANHELFCCQLLLSNSLSVHPSFIYSKWHFPPQYL